MGNLWQDQVKNLDYLFYTSFQRYSAWLSIYFLSLKEAIETEKNGLNNQTEKGPIGNSQRTNMSKIKDKKECDSNEEEYD